MRELLIYEYTYTLFIDPHTTHQQMDIAHPALLFPPEALAWLPEKGNTDQRAQVPKGIYFHNTPYLPLEVLNLTWVNLNPETPGAKGKTQTPALENLGWCLFGGLKTWRLEGPNNSSKWRRLDSNHQPLHGKLEASLVGLPELSPEPS